MAQYGVPERAIAQGLRIGIDELRQHYQTELDRGVESQFRESRPASVRRRHAGHAGRTSRVNRLGSQ